MMSFDMCLSKPSVKIKMLAARRYPMLPQFVTISHLLPARCLNSASATSKLASSGAELRTPPSQVARPTASPPSLPFDHRQLAVSPQPHQRPSGRPAHLTCASSRRPSWPSALTRPPSNGSCTYRNTREASLGTPRACMHPTHSSHFMAPCPPLLRLLVEAPHHPPTDCPCGSGWLSALTRPPSHDTHHPRLMRKRPTGHYEAVCGLSTVHFTSLHLHSCEHHTTPTTLDLCGMRPSGHYEAVGGVAVLDTRA